MNDLQTPKTRIFDLAAGIGSKTGPAALMAQACKI